MRQIIWIILLFAIPSFSQDLPTIKSIVENVSDQYDKVDDYSVKIKMSIQMPMFRMPRKRIDMYFKKPDKLKIESDGFAVVPKSGLTMSPDMFLKHLNSTTITLAEDGGYLVSGQVHADSLDFPIAVGDDDSLSVTISIHVKADPWIIDNVTAQLDTVTVFTIRSEYEEVEEDIWLPIFTEMDITFPDFGHGISGQRGPAQILEISKEPSKFGKITIIYSKYKVNRGIKDSFFNDADKFF